MRHTLPAALAVLLLLALGYAMGAAWDEQETPRAVEAGPYGDWYSFSCPHCGERLTITSKTTVRIVGED